MRPYFNYLFKTKWLQTVVMTIIPTFIFMLIIVLTKPTNPLYVEASSFGISVIFINIVLVVIVIFRFSSLRNPKEVDLYYALPISRKKLYMVHLFLGFVQLIIVWTVMFIIGFLTLLILSNGYYKVGFLLLLYIIPLFYLAILYVITSFLFLRAYTIFDGIAFISLFHVFFLFLSVFISASTLRQLGLNNPFVLNPFYALNEWTKYIISLTSHYPSDYASDSFTRNIFAIILNSTFSFLIALSMYIYNYRHVELVKTEKIGQLSDSKFGYRLFIPAILIVSIPSFFYMGSIITYLLLSIFISAGFIGFFIFRRSAKLKLIDVGFVIFPVIIGIILGFIINY